MIRTHTCGELRTDSIGDEVSLAGWVSSWRDHGGVVFIDLRDRYGLTQVVFNPEADEQMHQEARRLRSEFVARVAGKVRARPEGTVNASLPTGEVEVVATELEILNRCETPPIDMSAEDTETTNQRLQYRFLDLRRPPAQKRLIFRHEVFKVIRRYFDDLGFTEVETPNMAKSTPEGARDFLVPCRLDPGTFYALPQSPQLFKQLLMVGGLDRYYQIARCFRDEDVRAQRQPEFTQLDVEMSFITQEDIIGVIEGMMAKVFDVILARALPIPLPRLSYAEAMLRYGTDAPDTRFGLELADVTDVAGQSEFRVFSSAAAAGGIVKGLNAKGCGELSRKDIDDLTAFVREFDAKGLAWFRVTEQGLTSGITKFFAPEQLEEIAKRLGAEQGDLLLFVADMPGVVNQALCNLRLRLGRMRGLIDESRLDLVWIVDFPLVEWNAEQKRWDSMHHPFTAPRPEHEHLMEERPGEVLSQAYDLVLNGAELGGGSIRIHSRDVQQQVFRLLNIPDDEAKERFGFFLRALDYGAPPHGGIAFGLDRIVAMLQGTNDIREVIAFPKTQKGTCLLTGAPSAVDEKQLKELGIKLVEEP